MPTILPPDEHLTAGLTAVQKHIDYHEGELAALRGLRRQYKDALGIVAGDRGAVVPGFRDLVERPSVFVEETPATAIAVVEPTFDELVATMSGRVAVQ